MTTPTIPQPVRFTPRTWKIVPGHRYPVKHVKGLADHRESRSGHLGATDVVLPNLELDRQTFNLPTFQDISLNQWMALPPAEPVEVHLNLDETVMKALRRGTRTVVR